ncbi:MAG: UvrD-helicase domain-containing protein [Bacteroidales bacterium]|nr:UvrD-helicase domain-containing protein [Bacteroidales bacterium]MCI7050074.1 UvrD-helicase domain-containing protein [Bacteroidales bacterium]MDY4558464.1 UvrD-helicase domain-containing protein [Alloprevotella sp.]
MNNEVFQTSFNDAQLEAITYLGGPLLVVAGAGSGKTRVLTYKIAYLLREGCEPWRIMALTFTNKAAREMNERIARICSEEAVRGMWSGTFHSIFARMLRMESAYAGLPANYTIYDASDARSLVKTLIKELDLDDKIYKPSRVLGRISEAKNQLVLPDRYAADRSVQQRDHHDGMPEMYRLYHLYQQRLQAAAALDFDDILLHTYLLLHDHEEVRRRYCERFRYILVDEYQDTNKAQHRILSLLTTPQSNICVVGDDAQSIYGFRGADIDNILHFQQQYPGTKVVKLECNYRSTQCIVEAANSIIRHNEGQIPKKVYAAGEKGERIEVFSADSDRREAAQVARRIVNLHARHGVPFNEMAILYRTNAQSRSFEEMLRSSSIPYRVYGGLSFYQRKEVKDLLAYFRLVANTDDEEAFRRIINYPARGIGQVTLQKVNNAAALAGVSMWSAACHPERYGVELGAAAAGKLAAFCSLVESFREAARQQSVLQLAVTILEQSGMGRELAADRSTEGKARQENIDALLGAIKNFEDEMLRNEGTVSAGLTDFLSTVSLLTDTEGDEDDEDRVSLMTIHAAKGLEFDAVFVTGMEDDLFPNANAKLFPREMEEERRLFYVAVTRARRHCFLSYAMSRFRYGALQVSETSPFLEEIDDQYLKRNDEQARRVSGGSRLGWSDTHAWGGSERANNFDDFFGSPSDDALRHPSPASGYSRRQGGWNDGTPIPRRVVPPTPPAGYKRAGVSAKPVAGKAKAESESAWKIGMRIEHERFGVGTIVGTEGEGDSAKVRVSFDQAGEKNLLVKFAKFHELK